MFSVVTPPASRLLASLDAARQTLDDSAAEPVLNDFLGRATGHIETACKRAELGFGLTRLAETLRPARVWDHSEIRPLVLYGDIAPSIDSVTADGEVLDPADYELDGSLLYRLSSSGHWTHWRCRKVVVTYDTGWSLPTEAPDTLRAACLELLRLLWNNQGRDPSVKSSMTEGVGSTTYFDPTLSPGVGGALPGGICAAVEIFARHPV